jgi:hypothetical protein
VGTVLVVVGDPVGDLLEDAGGISPGADSGVVALQGLHEGLADPIASRAADRSEARYEVKGRRKVQCLTGRVGEAIVSKSLHRMGRPEKAEPLLNTSQHEVAHHLAVDAAGRGLPDDDLRS